MTWRMRLAPRRRLLRKVENMRTIKRIRVHSQDFFVALANDDTYWMGTVIRDVVDGVPATTMVQWDQAPPLPQPKEGCDKGCGNGCDHITTTLDPCARCHRPVSDDPLAPVDDLEQGTDQPCYSSAKKLKKKDKQKRPLTIPTTDYAYAAAYLSLMQDVTANLNDYETMPKKEAKAHKTEKKFWKKLQRVMNEHLAEVLQQEERDFAPATQPEDGT